MKRWLVHVIIWMIMITFPSYGQWTTTYMFSCSSSKSNDRMCRQVDTPLFKQLICSWDALRPILGAYRIWTRVRDAESKQWSSWYDMLEWGADTQRSLLRRKPDGVNQFVRLEPYNVADGFEVYVQACDGAMLSRFSNIWVNISYHDRMMHEKAEQYAGYASIPRLSVPPISQMCLSHDHHERMCSPTSVTMVLQYLTKQNIDPVDFACNAFDTGLSAYGSWPFNIAHANQYMPNDISLCVRRLLSFRSLYNYVRVGKPVIVSVRGQISGAPRPYPHGHLLVVIGFDVDNMQVICADPAMPSDTDVYVAYPLSDFLRAWERSHRLAYTIEKTIV